MLFFEDGTNVRSNQATCRGEGSGIAYNAVLQVDFDDTIGGTVTVVEPITLQEAKDWCRIDVPDDDALILRLITAARRICENHANLSFILRSVTAKIINGLGNFYLPYGPVQLINSVLLRDLTDIYDPLTFSVDDAYGSAYTVSYIGGYAVLPEELRNAVLCQIAWMYENRGDVKLSSTLSLESKLVLDQVRFV